MSTFEPFIIRKKCRYLVEFFYIFFYLYFARIYGPSEILLIYTSAAVAHDVRDITSSPTTVGAASSGPVAYNGHNVVTHGVMAIVSCATALGSGCLYNTEIQLKCHNNSKKTKRGGRGEGSEEEVVNCRFFVSSEVILWYLIV
jgi:hypothetical protein